ncbi:MAG: tetratricopeptide repeat protein [Bacteroidales bacterium]|nr:tetratricopeptide repeat protein [Lentimicrobiaceae bacterium]MDD5694016.1 tetratricopeptide repeat protein [Bacteroidales bacterium]
MALKSPEIRRKSSQHVRPGMINHILSPGILILCTFLTFSPVIRNDFVNFDDFRLITNNPLVINGADVMIRDFFQKNLFSPHFKPLVFLSWNIEYRLFGLNPKVFHLGNLLLHICNVILIWLISSRLIGQLPNPFRQTPTRNPQRFRYVLAVALSLLFALHPLHVESVAWASERKDLLCAFFYLLSLLSYVHYVRTQKALLCVLSAVGYLMVIGSKSMGITLVAVLFLVDRMLGREITIRTVAEKLPHLAVLILALYLYGLLGNFTQYASGLTDGIANAGNRSHPAYLADLSPLYLRLLVISTRIILWMKHIIIPVKLSPLYMQETLLKSLGYGVHFLVLLFMLLTILIFCFRKKVPWMLTGYLFFLITLSPALAIDERGTGVFIPDRYMYIPITGILMMAVGAARQLILFHAKLRPVVWTIFLFMAFLYGLSSHRLSQIWRNGESMWSHVLEMYPGEAAAWNGRGNYYNGKGDTLEALHDFNRAIALDPACYYAYNSRARIYCGQRDLDRALQDYLLITKVDPWFAEGFTNMGAVYGMKGQYRLALKALDRANQLKPSDPDILLNRGVTYLNMNEYLLCITDLNEYLLQRPGNAEVINTVGVCYLRLGQADKAEEEFKKALRLKPDFEICKNNLALCTKRREEKGERREEK